jgi:hypothetical protein
MKKKKKQKQKSYRKKNIINFDKSGARARGGGQVR